MADKRWQLDLTGKKIPRYIAVEGYINIFSQMYVLACRPVMVEIYT